MSSLYIFILFWTGDGRMWSSLENFATLWGTRIWPSLLGGRCQSYNRNCPWAECLLLTCCAWYGTKIEDVKHFLQKHHSWSLVLIHREGNYVAHLLAKFGISVSDKYVWIKEYPLVIHSTLLADLIN